MPETLLTLAARVEAAAGADRTGLNAEVAKAVGWQRITPSQMGRPHRSHGGWISPEDYLGRHSDGKPILDSLHGTDIHRDPPAFIYSLEPAMSLIPDWAKLHFLQDTEYDNPTEKTWSACLRARSWKEAEPGFGTEWQSWAATPALALCSAALKARAAK